MDRTPDTGVLVLSNDDMAAGGVFHCLAANIALKKDLAIFGFNGISIGEALPTPLSTIRSHRFDIGRKAVEAILGHGGPRDTPKIIDTGYEIIEGATA